MAVSSEVHGGGLRLSVAAVPRRGRWFALGVAYRDETDEVHVLAVASDIDPV